MPRALRWSSGGGQFLMSKVPLYVLLSEISSVTGSRAASLNATLLWRPHNLASLSAPKAQIPTASCRRNKRHTLSEKV
ncbi:hypothetical protein T484DRAFT_1955357 [Baffinella frigidus]|nr:hypothetical protein T484DRAFT_1955357 [Cryptophyta sp. CCMP2293]